MGPDPSDAEHIERSRRAYGPSAGWFVDAVGTEVSERFEAIEDRAMLDAFVRLAAARRGPVLDAGCGVGRIARYLADRGLDASGVDVAPGMIREAETAHPDLRFEVAEFTRLPVADGALTGVAYWYSIITTPPEELATVWSELARALSDGGVVLVAFQCGGGGWVERPKAYGTDTDLRLFHHDVEQVRAGLADVAIPVRSVLRRGPLFAHETTDQAVLIAHRPDGPGRPT
ncbi:MAG: methyltransferase domain-containing protein [Actinomycetota bacterium]